MNLSIIIPHFNTPQPLERLLSSIGQHEDVEVIVVDDNSTMHLEELERCKARFEGRQIRFFVNDSGIKGAGAARNVGMSHADGKWLMFADADDYYLDGMYETVSKYFEDIDSDIVFFPPQEELLKTSNLQVAKGRTEVYNLLCRAYFSGIKNADLYIRYSWSAPWSKMIRKSVIDENNIRFDEVMYANDVMFSSKVGFYAKVLKVSLIPIYCVTNDNRNLTKVVTKESFFTRIKVGCNKSVFLREHIAKEDYKNIYHPNALKCFYNVIQRKYGFRFLLKCYWLFKENNLRVFEIKIPLIRKLHRELRIKEKQANS